MYKTSKPYTKNILEIISSTWDAKYCKVQKTSDYPLIIDNIYLKKLHTDGIGTKGKLYWQKRSFKEAVQDALAMNLNDMLACNSFAYMLNCHLSLQFDDEDAILSVVKELAEECKKRGIAYVGGETSIMNNLEGMDISLTVAGGMNQQRMQKLKPGDAIVGFESSGIHCNGLTLARLVLGESYKGLTEPTIIYYDYLQNMLYNAKAVVNVTGGAFTRLKNLLEDDIDIEFSLWHTLYPQEIFWDIYKYGLEDNLINNEKMYSTFNCGIGLIAFMSQNEAYSLIRKKLPFKADVVGFVNKGNGNLIIKSKFGGEKIVFKK